MPHTTNFDIVIVGGGINGVNIARDAAGRGLSVYLCERDDLGNGNGGASAKLLHGGLRYLEFYRFNLNRGALAERESLLRAAPHCVQATPFILPHSPSFKPSWLMQLAMFIYDPFGWWHILPRAYTLDLRTSRLGKPLKKFVRQAMVYGDILVDDARLVILTALDAAARGAQIHPCTNFLGATRTQDGLWHIQVQAAQDDAVKNLTAKTIVNATGTNLDAVHAQIKTSTQSPAPLHMVRGSHILLPRLHDGHHGFVLQHNDRRMVFTVPFGSDYTLVGMTDQTTDQDQGTTKITEAEIYYLLEAVNLYFNKSVTRDNVSNAYAGVRPLFENNDGGGTDRSMHDYQLVYDDHYLGVYGGKITTFRRLAEKAVDLLQERGLGQKISRKGWTKHAVLPGGDMDGDVDDYTQQTLKAYPFLPEYLAQRFVHYYGTRVHQMMRGVTNIDDMGVLIGADLYTREVDFLCDHEWATTTDDILLRRTRLGLRGDIALRQALQTYLNKRGE